MNLLEAWLESLVEKPIQYLNEGYVDDQVVRAELDSLPLPKTHGHKVASSHVSAAVLQQLHEKIKGFTCEESIWNAVLWYCAHPLPIYVAHDLIDRGVSIFAMAFTRQTDEVQWRMATLVEDALYTLIRERYIDNKFSVSQFEVMLKWYMIRDDGVLQMLACREPSSPEKKAVFLTAVAAAKELLDEGANVELDQ